MNKEERRSITKDLNLKSKAELIKMIIILKCDIEDLEEYNNDLIAELNTAKN